MAPKNDISGMNYNLAVNYGNQFNFENGHSFGYLGSLSYRREQTVYETHRIIFSILVQTVRTKLRRK